MYKKFYEDVKLVKQLDYRDPVDFANDVLALLANFNEQEAVEQTLAPDVCHSTADGRHLFQNDSNGRYCFACGIRR